MLYHPVTGEVAEVAQTFAISGEQALEPFLNAWLPVPMLRVRGVDGGEERAFEEGPSNWARVFIARMSPNSAGDAAEPAYRVVLALDTNCEARPVAAGERYAAPTADDMREEAAFRFSSSESDVAWFVSEAWVDDWLREAYRDLRGRTGTAWAIPDCSPGSTISPATSLCSLSWKRAASPRSGLRRRSRTRCVGVDLVLDIGNTRTTALLSFAQPAINGAANQPRTRGRSKFVI